MHRQIASAHHVHWRKVLLVAVLGYLLVAYVLIPLLEQRAARKHPDLANAERVTRTGAGLPGDPINLALIGTERDLIFALVSAGWRPADALSIASSSRLVASTLFGRPDVTAPVSNLYLLGRKEDLAFEKPHGRSPRQRHHVRFWNSGILDEARPLWYGAATHDIGVEFSHTTGQITHRIAPDIDTERDLLFSDLQKANAVSGTREIVGFHRVTEGKNGGGDPWTTDGRLKIGVLTRAIPAPGQHETR